MPKRADPKCRSCAKLSAESAIALHGPEGDNCWDTRTCPKRRYHYRNRDLLNKRRRKGAANDPITLLPPSVPAAILHLYRERVDAPLHAVGAELWVGQRQQMLLEPVHCLGLKPEQIAQYLQSVLKEFSQSSGHPLDKFASQIEMNPHQCPIDPCPLRRE